MVRWIAESLIALVLASPANAIVLEVRRTGNIVDEPNSRSTRVGRVKGTLLLCVVAVQTHVLVR